MQTGRINKGRIMQNGTQAFLSISPDLELVMCFDGMGSGGSPGTQIAAISYAMTTMNEFCFPDMGRYEIDQLPDSTIEVRIFDSEDKSIPCMLRCVFPDPAKERFNETMYSSFMYGVGGCKQERDRMAWQAVIMDALDALLSLASIESDENTDVMAWLYGIPFGQNTLHDFLTKASDRELRAAHNLIGAAVRDGSFGLVFEEVNCIALDMADGVYASKQSKDVYIVAFCAVQVAQKLNNSSLSNTEYKPLQVSSQK